MHIMVTTVLKIVILKTLNAFKMLKQGLKALTYLLEYLLVLLVEVRLFFFQYFVAADAAVAVVLLDALNLKRKGPKFLSSRLLCKNLNMSLDLSLLWVCLVMSTKTTKMYT